MTIKESLRKQLIQAAPEFSDTRFVKETLIRYVIDAQYENPQENNFDLRRITLSSGPKKEYLPNDIWTFIEKCANPTTALVTGVSDNLYLNINTESGHIDHKYPSLFAAFDDDLKLKAIDYSFPDPDANPTNPTRFHVRIDLAKNTASLSRYFYQSETDQFPKSDIPTNAMVLRKLRAFSDTGYGKTT